MNPEEVTLQKTAETRAWLGQQTAQLREEQATLLEEREGLTERKHIRQLYGDALMGRIKQDALRQRQDRIQEIDARLSEIENWLAGIDREHRANDSEAGKAQRVADRRKRLDTWMGAIRKAVEAGSRNRLQHPGERREINMGTAMKQCRDLAENLDEQTRDEVEALFQECGLAEQVA